MITVDERIFDTDLRWEKYCKAHNIKNPFKEEIKRITSKKYEKAWYEDWKKRRDEYLRLEHTFRAWDCHFWMDWEKFERFFRNETYTDMSIYLPCDCADRQCSLACAYFLGKCPRQEEELKSPIKGLEGRYEV